MFIGIQDETFGEITFDGLNWIKTEPVSLAVAGNKFELRAVWSRGPISMSI